MKNGVGKKRSSTKQPTLTEKKKKHRQSFEDEEIDSGGSSGEDLDSERGRFDEPKEDDLETADEKRLRLAKGFIEALRSEGNEDDESIGRQLQRDWQETTGTLMENVAGTLKATSEELSAETRRVLRGHHLAPTCVCITSDGKTAFSGGKDCQILIWDVETGEKVGIRGSRIKKMAEKLNIEDHHTAHVLAVAVSDDGNYLVSGGRDKKILVWDIRSQTIINTLKSHKDAVSGLVFRDNSQEFYSCSHDRSVKVWNVGQKNLIDTLYGHQTPVEAVVCLSKERPISCGGDQSCRLWKISEESQLIYKGHSNSIDCISMINEDAFVSGSQDGAISLWSTNKKRPVFVYDKAHKESVSFWNETNWISSIAAKPYSDLVASGSSDGTLNLWQVHKDTRISKITSLPMRGFINGICFARSEPILVAAVGQEHRLGRWARDSSARNSIQIVRLPFHSS